MSLIQRGIKINAIIDNRENVDSKLIYEVEKSNIKIFKFLLQEETLKRKKRSSRKLDKD